MDSVKVSVEPKVAEPVAVKVGDALPMASLLKPTSQTFRMILAQAGQEREIGSTQTVVTETTVNGAAAFMIVQTLSSPMIGTGTDTVVVSKATLAPIRERSTNARRTLSLDFDGPRVRGTIKPAMDTAQRVSVDAKEPMFHSAALGLLIRALPLADGYAVKIPAYAHEAGGAITVTSRVIASSPEKLSDGRTVDAWVVETDIAGQKVKSYIAKDSRELVRTVLVAAPGVEVRMTP